MKLRAFFLTAFCCISLGSMADNGVNANILNYFKQIAAYDSRCTQEKVYLHLDNNSYFVDETVYFKAYIVRASSLKYTDLSKVLYVELLDDHGYTIERKSYEISDGQASGSIPLSGLMHGGYYEVRAFTRAMLNWDSEYCFSRVIPVYETKDTTGNYLQPFLYTVSGEDQVPMKRDDPSTLRKKDAQKDRFYVEFYPEGGNMVRGMSSRVAFRVTDKNGNPINTATCSMTDTMGHKLTAATEHEGMGMLTIPSVATVNKCTFAVDGNTGEFTLPAPLSSGVTAAVNRTGGKLSLDISATPDLAGQYAGISITCRGAACHFDTVRLAARKHWEMPDNLLHYGINQITLFSASGDILWERLVWRQPDYPVGLEIRQNAEEYSPFQPVVLDITLKDRDGHGCNSYLSLAVHDTGTEQAGNDEGIMEDLLLSSDLRGYISHPEYYFAADDETHRHWLDLLLMVQGWRRYDFREMAGIKPFELKEPVETGQLLTGHLVANHKRLKEGNVSLNVNIFFAGLHAEGSCKTDTLGNFAMMLPSYYGEGIGRFTAMADGKKKDMQLFLDRNFAPTPRMFDVQEMVPVKPIHSASIPFADTFAWQDTITKGDIMLGTAVVKGKLKDNPASWGDHWNGGEDFARRNADICYNIDIEAQKYCDNGEDDPLLWDLLKSLNKRFDYTTGDAQDAGTLYEFTYRNYPAVVFRHNTEQDQGRISNLVIMASEVSRVYIITDQEKIRRVLPQYGNSERPVTGIFLYGDGVQAALKDRFRTKVVRFFGYSRDADFPSPDYRKRDLPDKHDFRRTLYWNPDVLTDANGKATVIFYSNARPGVKLGITARAVLPDGELIDYSR